MNFRREGREGLVRDVGIADCRDKMQHSAYTEIPHHIHQTKTHTNCILSFVLLSHNFFFLGQA